MIMVQKGGGQVLDKLDNYIVTILEKVLHLENYHFYILF